MAIERQSLEKRAEECGMRGKVQENSYHVAAGLVDSVVAQYFDLDVIGNACRSSSYLAFFISLLLYMFCLSLILLFFFIDE